MTVLREQLEVVRASDRSLVNLGVGGLKFLRSDQTISGKKQAEVLNRERRLHDGEFVAYPATISINPLLPAAFLRTVQH